MVERIDSFPRRGRVNVEHLSTLEKVFLRFETVGLKPKKITIYETVYLIVPVDRENITCRKGHSN